LPEKNCGGLLDVYIDNDKLKAYLIISDPGEKRTSCVFEEALSALKQNNVVFGIKEDKIREALQGKKWKSRILVAEGRAPIDGKDARLEYMFQNGENTVPKVDKMGNADFYDLGLVNNVRKGELLIKKTPCQEGTPGTDISGNPVPARQAKDINLPIGKNTVADEEGKHLFAAKDGHIIFTGSRIEVNPVFNVVGDVDYSTGNIDFWGSVIINGSVKSGFRVNAEENIEVHGSIEGADVKAKANIIVKGGITGSMKGRVTAGQNIYARFIENAHVEAGSNVFVKEAIIQSRVKAGNSIKVSDNKALIVGGIIQAGEEVESKVMGSQMATQTIVEVGVNPYIKDEYQKLIKKQLEKEKGFQSISYNIQVYNKKGIHNENLDDKKKELIIKLLDYYQILRKELQEIAQKKELLEKQLTRYQTAQVKVINVVYPGVRIVMKDLIYLVNDPVKNTRFLIEDGEIRTSALR